MLTTYQIKSKDLDSKVIDSIKSNFPDEELIIDVPMEFSGNVIEKISKRRGIMKDMMEKEGVARIIFEMDEITNPEIIERIKDIENNKNIIFPNLNKIQ